MELGLKQKLCENRNSLMGVDKKKEEPVEFLSCYIRID